MNSHSRRSRGLVAAASAGVAIGLLLVAPTAATATKATTFGRVVPDHGPPGTPLTVTVGFTLDPEAGQSSIVTRSVVQIPHGGILNGRLFPSCDPETINTRRNFSACPKGSLIGRGTARADVPAVDTFNVPAAVTLFNGAGGNSMTVHVYAENPALVSYAFTAPLRRTGGRFAYALTVPVPPQLQEINDGWFVEIRRFTAVLGATIVDRRSGRRRGYVELGRCPRSRSVPIATSFEFLRESAPTSASGAISCRP